MGFFTFGTGADAAKSSIDSAKQNQGEAWNLQKSDLSQIEGALRGYLMGNVGYDPKMLALLKSQFLNSTAKNYAGANAAVKAALARSGSAGGPMGGDAVRPIASLEGGLADTASGGLMNIDISNLQQALNNKFNAAQIFSGNARTLGDSMNTFTNQLNNGVNAYTNSVRNGFGSHFMSNLGDSLGASLGKGFSAGLGSI